jgi:hypothetical protein
VAVACGRSPQLEELPAGADVTIRTQDGQLVSGKLVKVEPDIVELTRVGDDGRIWVSRPVITEVDAPEDEADRPSLREITVPAGSTLRAALETTVASNASEREDPVRAKLAAPIVIDGTTLAPSGSILLGRVTAAQPAGRVKGRAELRVRFDRLQTQGVTYDIRTNPLVYVARATKGEDAAKIGIGAAAGAAIGGIAGGRKGAAVGSAIGAGGGTAVVLATLGEDIRLSAGTELSVELASDLTITVPADRDS